jgi:hypothetical protein
MQTQLIGATNIALTPTLSCSCSEPNGNAMKFDIYFWENTSATKKVTDQSVT